MAEKRTFIIAREGLALILASLALAIFFYAINYRFVAVFFGAFTLFNIYFFRNPKRFAPEGNSILAPADGEVILIKEVYEDKFLKQEAVKISIFMSIFNVHINRTPISGTVLEVKHESGSFFSADLDKATENNEKNYLLIEGVNGFKLLVVQVAGLIARRIVCDVKKGDFVNRGEPYGLICYGSRLDMYLPKGVKLNVSLHSRTKAGETVIGELQNV